MMRKIVPMRGRMSGRLTMEYNGGQIFIRDAEAARRAGARVLLFMKDGSAIEAGSNGVGAHFDDIAAVVLEREGEILSIGALLAGFDIAAAKRRIGKSGAENAGPEMDMSDENENECVSGGDTEPFYKDRAPGNITPPSSASNVGKERFVSPLPAKAEACAKRQERLGAYCPPGPEVRRSDGPIADIEWRRVEYGDGSWFLIGMDADGEPVVAIPGGHEAEPPGWLADLSGHKASPCGEYLILKRS